MYQVMRQVHENEEEAMKKFKRKIMLHVSINFYGAMGN